MFSSLLTPVTIFVVALLALTFWRVEQRRRWEREDETTRYARMREERQFAADEADREVQSEERALRTAAIIPERSRDGQFILVMTSDDALLMLETVAAAQRLYTEHGFEVPDIEEISRGSVKIRFSTRIRAFFRDPRSMEIVRELRVAAEEATIGRLLSENNERNANAAAILIGAMSKLDSGEYISAGLVVRVDRDEQGRSRVVSRVPTPRERAQLEADYGDGSLPPLHRGQIESTPVREIASDEDNDRSAQVEPRPGA